MATQLRSSKYVYVLIMLMFVLLGMVFDFVQCDEREECTNQLIGLSTCLPYVGGTAKAPTLDCCRGMKEVLAKSKKCLCLLVKNRNDPTLGLKINATLALNLPSICKSDVTIADCPDAQVFQQFEKSLHKSSPTPADAHPANSTSTAASGSRGMELKTVGQISLWLLTSLLIVG
ncbi:hypothetical protein AQUCO_00900072v1 [Aquilegia coerulea]|uniref:Bifunctional inhibitor/plant lipid transfer protein/seed storage helical domain-containing protein n=1 Tax=Aquilegia coerulea TaxID=218851 RepID=A0A2G5EC05_AQUCA|nr:hypothetical protein AQUCO_00900072v1 [Aquilegia coerulea]